MSAPVRIGLRYPVVAPTVEPPPFGLTSVARRPDDGNDRWMSGFTYRPDLPAKIVRNRSIMSAAVGTNLGNEDDIEDVDYVPWMLTIEDPTSTINRETEDLEKRAERLLEYYTSRLLEYELWHGEIAQEDELPNRYLTDGSATNVTATTDLKLAVARLMQGLTDLGISTATIHVPMAIGIQLPDEWKSEYTWENYGFVICTGAGYPNTGTIYATDMVNVRLGDIEVEGGVEAINIHDNTIRHYAKRVGAAEFAGPILACQISA